MKIDSQLDYTIQSKPTFHQGKDFELVLKNIRQDHQPDDNYWQHQHHLQLSALQFNSQALLSKSNLQVPLPHDSDGYSKHTETERLIDLRPSLTPNQTQDQINNQQEKPLPKINTDIFFEKPISISAQNPINSSIAKDPINNKSHSTIRPWVSTVINTVIKPYQLFLNNRDMEIAISLPEASKHETKTLKQLIKSWINQTGITLKQLIINGVKQ